MSGAEFVSGEEALFASTVIPHLCFRRKVPRTMVDHLGAISIHIKRSSHRGYPPVVFTYIPREVGEWVKGKELALEALIKALASLRLIAPRLGYTYMLKCLACATYLIHRGIEPNYRSYAKLLNTGYTYTHVRRCTAVVASYRQFFAYATKLLEEWPASGERVCSLANSRLPSFPPRAVVIPVRAGGAVVWSSGEVLDRLSNELGCERCVGYAQCRDVDPDEIAKRLRGIASVYRVYASSYETFLPCSNGVCTGG